MKTGPQKDAFLHSVENSNSSNAVVSHGVEKVPSQWSALRNRNYALLFWGYLVSSAGTQMQIVAVAWQVYLLTHSAVALGIIGLLQAIPRLLLSLVGGVFADRFDRRKLLLVIESTMAAASAV